MGWLSVNINFSGREVLLVGAGRVGWRKLGDLLAAGARVTVVEPRDDPGLDDLAAKGLIRLEREYRPSLLDPRPWVFVAADDPGLAGAIAGEASGRGLLVNVADRPADCDFIMPALVLDPPFRLTVNTEGASPALSAAVANELRAQYRGYGALAGLLGRLRPLVLGADLARERRRDIFRALAEDKSLPALMAEGRYGEVRGLVEGHLAPVRLPGDFSIP